MFFPFGLDGERERRPIAGRRREREGEGGNVRFGDGCAEPFDGSCDRLPRLHDLQHRLQRRSLVERIGFFVLFLLRSRRFIAEFVVLHVRPVDVVQPGVVNIVFLNEEEEEWR